jgi:hypothetical protein
MEKAMVMRGTFVFGLIAAILVASAISIVASTQLVIGPQGSKGDTGDTAPQGAQGTQGATDA